VKLEFFLKVLLKRVRYNKRLDKGKPSERVGRKATGLNPKIKIQRIWRQGCPTDLSHPPLMSIKHRLITILCLSYNLNFEQVEGFHMQDSDIISLEAL
jgi:hypothetical protein